LVDLDGDGRSDLISGSWPGELYFFRRGKDGSLAAPEQLKGPDGKPLNLDNGTSVFAVDWDASGTLDLLVGNARGEVFFLPGQGQNQLTFGPPQPVLAAGEKLVVKSGEAAPVAADWDGDGKLDLVLGAEDGSVVWHRNLGTPKEPKLAAAKTLLGESKAGWNGDDGRAAGEWGLRVKPCVVDWNGDGQLDLLLGDRCGSFAAKPAQTDEERADERRAMDRLPQLRKAWSAAFAEYSAAQAATGSEQEKNVQQMELLRSRLVKLKSEIAHEQETRIKYQAGYQTHGFVWVFLRKPAGDRQTTEIKP